MKGNKCIVDDSKKILFKNRIELYPYESNTYFSLFLYKGKTRNRIWIKAKCSTCGKETFQDIANSKKANRCFCSRDCQTKGHSGKNSPSWQGGRKLKRKNDPKSSVLIYNPSHPNCNRDGYICEHRLIVEESIGRYLEKTELIHHIDCDHSNNDIINLDIVSQEEHNQVHWSLNNLLPILLERGVIIYDKIDKRYKIK